MLQYCWQFVDKLLTRLIPCVASISSTSHHQSLIGHICTCLLILRFAICGKFSVPQAHLRYTSYCSQMSLQVCVSDYIILAWWTPYQTLKSHFNFTQIQSLVRSKHTQDCSQKSLQICVSCA